MGRAKRPYCMMCDPTLPGKVAKALSDACLREFGATWSLAVQRKFALAAIDVIDEAYSKHVDVPRHGFRVPKPAEPTP